MCVSLGGHHSGTPTIECARTWKFFLVLRGRQGAKAIVDLVSFSKYISVNLVFIFWPAELLRRSKGPVAADPGAGAVGRHDSEMINVVRH